MKFPLVYGLGGLLGADLVEAWEFMAIMDLAQIIRDPTHSSDRMLDLMSLILDSLNSEEEDNVLMTVSLATIWIQW